MEVEKIPEMLELLINSNQKAIIIDGKWGIGKTYQINKFIENNKKNKGLRIVYVSLFGLDSIAEIHTKLYKAMHPTMKIVKDSLSVISPAVDLIPYAGKTVSEALKFSMECFEDYTDETKDRTKEKEKIKRQDLVIFDDLERSKGKLDFGILLGYINQLFLSKIKVAVFCDESKIAGEDNGDVQKDYYEFKEKIFDRQYSILKAPKKAMSDFFALEGDTIADDKIIDLFENNVRMASKTANLFNEIITHINNLKIKKNIIQLNYKTILWYASLVVCFVNDKKRILNYRDRLGEDNFIIEGNLSSFDKDEIIKESLMSAVFCDIDSNYIYSCNYIDSLKLQSSRLISAVGRIYKFNDYSELDSFLIIKDFAEEKEYLGKDLFYLSDEEKRIKIDKLLNYFSTTEGPLIKEEVDSLCRLFVFKKYFPPKFDDSAIVDCISKRFLESDYLVLDRFKITAYNNNATLDIYNKIESKAHENLYKNYINSINELTTNKDYVGALNLIERLKKDGRYKIPNTNKINDSIMNQFINHDFYLPDLDNTIDEDIWRFAKVIVDFAKENSSYELLRKIIIKRHSNSLSNSGMDRYIELKNYLDM